ncbi:Isochorismatase hydrolase [Stipitochalara longipes BDJ]|nr:Isochorismatase hydrolase [Stipitochalara longipes BDJ]
MAALILVDLQADFLDHKQDRPPLIDPRPFGRLLPSLIRTFTARELPITWVQSAYSAVPHGTCFPFPGPPPSSELQNFESYLTSTHTSSRFCTPGSSGAELLLSLATLKHPHHTSIKKSWYSAFTETSLHETLQSSATTHVYIAGVTTNTCVAATSVHARRHGYEVTVISDLVFSLKPETSQKALNTLTSTPYNVLLCTTDQVPAQIDSSSGTKLPELYYVNGSIPSWRVMLVLSQKRVPYKATRLRIMTTPKETRSEEFLAINPRGKTPTFVDVDGTVVIESLAILAYLEQYYSSDNNMPLMLGVTKKKQWTREITRIAESENPHNIYEPIELLYMPDWKLATGKIIEAYHETLAELGF